MVSVATKIGMFTMLSTMALGSEFTSEDPMTPEQELGNALAELLAGLKEDVDEIKRSFDEETNRDGNRRRFDSLKKQMDLLETK